MKEPFYVIMKCTISIVSTATVSAVFASINRISNNELHVLCWAILNYKTIEIIYGIESIQVYTCDGYGT